MTLKQLVRFGQPPLSTQSLQACTDYARTELPVRLARRVRAFQSLPFIVGTNPYIKDIYTLYYDSFETLVKYTSNNDDAAFIETLKDFVSRHSDNIPTLARGKHIHIYICIYIQSVNSSLTIYRLLGMQAIHE